MMERVRSILILVLVFLMFVFPGFGHPAAQDDSQLNGIRRFLKNCHFLEEISHRNLAVIPVTIPEGEMAFKILTLDEVIKSGNLIIKEVSQSGSVNSLSLQNKSDGYVFIMAGEILSGSKQDRILQQDVLLPPNSNKTIISAFCVERGRWNYKSKNFYSEGLNAPPSVRQSAKVDKEQGRVWSQVSGSNTDMLAVTVTDSITATSKSTKFKKERKGYWEKLSRIPEKYKKANGIVVLVNRKVMVADLFSRRDVFEKMWEKLLDSYIAEAIRRRGKEVPSTYDSLKVFFQDVLKSKISCSDSPGAGEKITIESEKLAGSGISLKSLPVHLDIFPAVSEAVNRKRNPIQRNYFQQERRED